MATSFRTPLRPTGNEGVLSVSQTGGKVKAVDLVTGKAKVEYFFDPSLLISDERAETPFKSSGSNGNVSTPFRKDLSTAFDASEDPLMTGSKHLFMPCTIIKHLDASDDDKGAVSEPIAAPTLVKTSDGTLHKIRDSSKLVKLVSPEDYLGISDVLHLPNVTEASLVHTLRLRYRRDEIYTSAGPILLSINPYKMITFPNGESLYSENIMLQYRKKTVLDQELPPHLFQVADRAYSALLASVHLGTHAEDEDPAFHTGPGMIRNQSIIISGESGAGKTEATKYIMQYLARITKRPDASSEIRSPDGKMIAALEDRVLSSNPLLESFGNARTLRNDNSSRFGKFIHIYFSTETGTITGASISNYLLEKTRITHQTEGERNYHIFYQLLAGASDEMLAELGLEAGVSGFQYLGNRETQKSRRDANGFVETKECLSRIGLSLEDQRIVFSIAAAVLHMGNIEFEEKGDEADENKHSEPDNAKVSEASRPSLVKACELLGLDEEKVSEAILTKLLTIGGKTIHKSQSVAQAAEKRDALAKLTYSCLFLWLVRRVNETFKQDKDGMSDADSVGDDFVQVGSNQTGFIGVLDIYGFEVFEVNGYEQLLINYCNEKLQRHFNRHLFEVEQDLYASEGVDWTYITFNDNRLCLELIEGGSGSVGILNTLDDAWGGMGNASEKDVKFVSQLHKLFGSTGSPVKSTKKKKKNKGGGGGVGHVTHKHYVTPKFGNDRQFIVVHYAGDVRYTANGFVEKNMETLSNELKDLGAESTVPLAKKVFSCGSGEDEDPDSPRRSTIRGVSVATQFKASLQSLVTDLERTQPHYIRCIKPNLSKAPNSFDSGEVLRQLRYSGMMEAIRIRREGYALREDHESFFNRFSVLLQPEDLGEEAGIEQLVKVLSKRLSVTQEDWQIGHSKIFLRRELAAKLERLAALKVHAAARTISRFGRFVAERRASKAITAWARFRLLMATKYRRDRAANVIMATYKGYKQQQQYSTMRAVVLALQSHQRRKLATAFVSSLRDPYADYSFKDMKKLHKAELARLDEAVRQKDFKGAAEIEKSIEEIKVATESKRPRTRTWLEAEITEAQKALDDALQRKAYEQCGPLQEKLESLVAQRVDLPTLDELKEQVQLAEKDVADAAARRDFAAAASGQARIDEAKSRLEEAIAAEKGDDDESSREDGVDAVDGTDGYTCRAEVEAAISELQEKVKKAIESKDFVGASSLQSTLDAKEHLREIFPSVEELQSRLAEANQLLDKAVTDKDFTAAGKLHEQIDDLEKKLAKEKDLGGSTKASTSDSTADESTAAASFKRGNGEEIIFTSRADLEDEISETSKHVTDAVDSKEFKKAEELQSMVDLLEALRTKLPSLAELEAELKDKKRAMDEAVKGKKFAQADEIHNQIEQIEAQVATERSKMPAVDDMTTKSTPVVGASVPRAASVRTLSGGAIPKSKIAQPPTSISTPKPRRDARDDLSEVSLSSGMAPLKTGTARSSKSNLAALGESSLERPVSKLRPKKPLISSANDTILSMTQMLSNKRGDASLVVDASGGLAGIITDTDITRRVVAKDVDPSSSTVSVAMTPNPTCVSMTDSAMDALGTMVENHFRHLPVVDDSGAVVGLLDIAKCLNDAISKLERSQEKGSSAAEDAVKQVAGLQGAGGAQAAALQALLGPLMAQAFGNQASPSLRSLLAGKPATVVAPSSSIREAGMLMSERRKAALVVEDGELVGIFGFKDMMSRAIARELPLDVTEVRSVMTPSPESVSPDMTVLEALQTMHDHRFLTLPVCESDGRVVGLVDVMDVISSVGGAEGWRSVFSSAMDIDDISDTSSVCSHGDGSRIARSIRSSRSAVKKDERPVSKLRPKKPLISSENDSILSMTQMLANKRGDASLVVDASGGLSGIITDTDITRRVVAKDVDPSSSTVSVAMTPNPTCVSMSDSAMDALGTMVENHFRHLPVVDDSGAVVGLLDIAKCLNDAITKLERAQEKGSSAAEDAVKQAANLQGAGGAQAAALQALLGPLMAQAFGNQTSPSLRSLLAGKPATVVSPGSSVRDAAVLMAERRKAALVVEDGELVGIFGFKDMMTRAVAKELPLDVTEVRSVMTPNPESVSPDMTVLEALQMMHDHRFLTLPVCESDGRVVGLIDVMDTIYGVGGAEGWRSVFSSAMEIDDASDASSVYSQGGGSRVARSVHSSARSEAKKEERPVSKLRPKKPLISSTNDSILSMTQMLSNKRGDASLVVDASGGLAGIITDTDITRRVVAKDVDPSSSTVSVAMTPNPTCVSMTDSAMDALGTMVENHFRHLPVVDDSGAVVGLLDIAKCLNDAISKLERSQEKGSSAAEDAVKQVAGLQGAGGAQAAALQALLGPLMAQAFGNQASPSLRSLLAGKPATVVAPSSSIRDAGTLMAESRKAALVVEDGELVGIFGFKDMMTRAVAKELPLELTKVKSVMTPSPEFVSPEMTVLEAMQTMHDHKFLTLPVCEADGSVVGLVDILDIIHGCGGAEGWRSVFQHAIDLEGFSETNSVHSRDSASRSIKSSRGQKKSKADSRPVSKLRPRKPVIASGEDTILQASQMLAQARIAAVIVTDSSGCVSGIMTDHDITRRVVAKQKDAATTALMTVMTPNPSFVSMSESAMDALSLMIEHHYRYLPVLDDDGVVSGLLDIGKCLNDAISKLEHAQEKSTSAADDAVKQMAALQGASGANAAALQALLAPVMAQAFGDKASPTLRTFLSGKTANKVDPDTSVLEAAEKMAEKHKAALVVENGELIGILSFKDVMTRVIAKELPIEVTAVSDVMTPDPEAVSPDITLLEALQVMHDHNFLTLPVCETDGAVVGCVDVMDLIYSCGGADGWRSIFDSAMDIEDEGSETQTAKIGSSSRAPVIQVAPDAPFVSSNMPNNIPSHVEIDEAASDHGSINESLITDTRGFTTSPSPYGSATGPMAVFKLTDPSGHTHRIRSELSVSSLLGLLSKKMRNDVDIDSIHMKFVDDEGDAIMITSDDCLAEAAQLAQKSGSDVVKLTVTVVKPKLGLPEDKTQLAIAGAAAAVAVGAIALYAFRR